MKTHTKYGVPALAATLITTLVVCGGLTPARAASSYYVDCSAGSNGDGSQSSPWNNLGTVNGTTFGAGDQILFRRGTTCTGTLWPKGSGSCGSPIVVDAYCTGTKPHIAGSDASNAVTLYNQEYWEIHNLEVSNDSASASNRRGIYLKLENFGTGDYYRLLNLTVHDVKGDNTKDKGGSSGIHLDVYGSSTQTKFNDVLIDGNTVYTVDRSGINMSSAWWCRASVACSGGYSLSSGNISFDYNVFYGNHPFSEPTDAHKITADPKLVNPGSGSTGRGTVGGYQLQAGSPAIGSGRIVANNGGKDFWGNSVSPDCAPDRGAHQFSDNSAPCDPTPTSGPTYTPAPTATPPNSGQNLVVNPGLETGSLPPWTQWNSSVVNHDQRSGNYALRVANPPGTSEQTITGLTPSTTYVFSGWGKVATAGEPICLGYKWYGGSQWTACPNTTSYMHVSNLFTTGATDTPPPTDTPTPAPTVPAGTNLLTNPGFETGSLPPWTLATGNGGVTLSFPRSGSYSGYVGTGVGRIEQTVTGLKPNTTYDLAAWIKLASGADSVRVGVKDYGGADSYESATSTSYTQVSLEFTTGGSNTSATVNLYQPDSGESYAWSDDWSLTAQ